MDNKTNIKKNILNYGYNNVRNKSEKLRIGNCNFCKAKIVDGQSTTSNFLRHMKTHRARYDEFMSQRIINTIDQTKLDDFPVQENLTYGFNHPKQRRILAACVKDLIVGCTLPISLVEKPQFRHFCLILDASTRDMSKTSVVAEIDKLSKQTKCEIINLIEKTNNIALTIDIWSDKKMRGFLGVTAHMIVNYKLHTCLLACDRFMGRHSGENIFEAFTRICSSFKMKDKIRYVITDNASNMVKAFSTEFIPEESDNEETDGDIDVENPDLWENVDDDVVIAMMNHVNTNQHAQPLKRLACFIHTLQLSVGDGLKEAKIYTTLGKLSKITSMLHTSTIFKEKFENEFGPNVSIPQPNTTRWNSTLHHVISFLKLDREKITNALNDCNNGRLIISTKEYDQLHELEEILTPFLDATNTVQGENMVTVSAVVPSVIGLYYHLNRLESIYLTNMVSALKRSIEVRFSGILVNVGLIQKTHGRSAFSDMIYFFASVLDPNFFFWWLERVQLTNPESKDALKQRILSELRTFALKFCKPSTTLDSEQNGKSTKKARVSSLFSYTKPISCGKATSGQASFDKEMRMYEDLICTNDQEPINVLEFWKIHSQNLPLLSEAALSILMVPGSSAPVERVFSVGGIVMRPHRNRLGASMVEKIVFLKCNLDKL